MFQISQLFFYKVVFMAELFVSEMLFTLNLRKRKGFWLRFVCALIMSVGLAFLFPLFGLNNPYYTSFMFFALFACSFALLFFLYDESFISLLFCAVASYSLQHLAYLFYTITCSIFGVDLKTVQSIYLETIEYSYNPTSFGVYFVCYFIVYWAGYILFARRVNKNEKIAIDNLFMLVLSAVLIVSEILVNAVITYESYNDYNVTFIVAGKVAGIVCCLLALSLQFNLALSKSLSEELSRVRLLWRQERRQYEASKVNVELINKKCHDLKYQIRTIGEQRIIETDVINEIESAVSFYDSAVKTGNDALDIIIREKSLQCSSNAITLTCVLNGKELSFIKDTDLYTLFGNALDNAIEAVLKLDEKYRVINITGLKTGDMLSVGITNYYGGEIKFSDGLPLTGKDGGEYHGFGMKSIRDIVEKYGGNLAVSVKDGVFSLNMLFFVGKITE